MYNQGFDLWVVFSFFGKGFKPTTHLAQATYRLYMGQPNFGGLSTTRANWQAGRRMWYLVEFPMGNPPFGSQNVAIGPPNCRKHALLKLWIFFGIPNFEAVPVYVDQYLRRCSRKVEIILWSHVISQRAGRHGLFSGCSIYLGDTEPGSLALMGLQTTWRFPNWWPNIHCSW